MLEEAEWKKYSSTSDDNESLEAFIREVLLGKTKAWRVTGRWFLHLRGPKQKLHRKENAKEVQSWLPAQGCGTVRGHSEKLRNV